MRVFLTIIFVLFFQKTFSQIFLGEDNINETIDYYLTDNINISKELDFDYVLLKKNDSLKISFNKNELHSPDDLNVVIYNDTTKFSNFQAKKGKIGFLPVKHNDIIDIHFYAKGVIIYSYRIKIIYRSATLGVNDGSESTIVNEVNTRISEIKNSMKIKFEYGDNILNDARILINPKKDHKIIIPKIFEKYNLNIEDPFMAYVKKLKTDQTNSGKLGQMGSNIVKADVTNFATGMARFLADRAKQELTETFFVQMGRQMEKVPELQVYFNSSYVVLKRFSQTHEGFDLDDLRLRFNQDLQKLPTQMYYTIQNGSLNTKYPQLNLLRDYLNNDTKGIFTKYVLENVLASQGKVNPKDLMYKFSQGSARKLIEQKLYTDLLGQSLDSAFKNEVAKEKLRKIYTKWDDAEIVVKDKLTILTTLNTIKLAELISNSLLSANVDRYWVNEEEISELFTNDKLFKTYIGLALAKSDFEAYQIRFAGVSLKKLVEDKFAAGGVVNDAELHLLRNLIKNIYYSYKEVDQTVGQLKSMASAQAVEETYKIFNVFKNNLDVINTQLLPVINSDVFAFDSNRDLIDNLVGPAVDISYYFYAKKYPQAIKNFTMLLQNSLTYNNLEQNAGYKKFISKFHTYGSLVAAVGVAQNADEVKAAISAAALPAGSSRIKRNSAWAITTNAYVGGFYGKASYQEFGEKRSIATFGISAPIGVSVSKGNIGFLGSKNALSLNLQLIDLGSLVNFYLKEGDGAQLPADTKIQLGDILAPGASIAYSLFNSPISFKSGIQYVPNLSRVQHISTNADFRPLTWRWDVGLAVDIPLFTLKVWN